MSVLMSAADVSPIPMKIQETMVSQAGTAMSLILSPSSERPLFSERLWCFLPARSTWPPLGRAASALGLCRTGHRCAGNG